MENMTAKVNMLTIKEAASLVNGLSEYRIRRMCIDGNLPYIKAGRKYLINQDVIMSILFGIDHKSN